MMVPSLSTAQSVPRNRPLLRRWSWLRRIPALPGWLRRHVVPHFSSESLLPEAFAIAGFLALLWAGVAITLNLEYRSAEDAARQATSNLARAFEESTRRTIGQIDQILRGAAAFYAAQGSRFSFADWASAQVLPDPMTTAIGMADASGHVFADTLPISGNVSIADRPHFLVQRDPARNELFISRPVHGRVSGKDTIQFTRKLIGPDGGFAGVTVLSLGCNALSRFYQTLDLGQGFVALLSADGTVLARGPLVPGRIGQKIPQTGPFSPIFAADGGTVTFRSARTGLIQIASFRQLRDYGLIVLVGLDADTVLQSYHALRQRAVFSGCAVSFAVGIIGLLWLQQKRRSVASRRALTITLDTISQGILMVDAAGRVPVVNPRALDLLGVDGNIGETAPDHAASRARLLTGRGAGPIALAAPADVDASGGDSCFETAREDGTVIEVRSHPLAEGGFVHTYTDVTAQRLADARVRYLAHHDPLTGLPNRVQLRERVPEFLDQSDDASPGTALLTAFVLIDLDGFKNVNDTLGHDVGDELLAEVARRLQGLVRQVDFVARLGGDEFVLLLPGLSEPDAATPLLQGVLRRLAEPMEVGDHRLRIGASIGAAFHPRDARDGDTLFKHADIALYAAKAAGRGTFRCFEPAMTAAVNERRLLESGLRHALDNGQFELHYQPIFNGHTLRVAGFEALIRWRQPDGGYVSPETFVRIAEDCGLINRIGRWVLEQACSAAVSWPGGCRVAVNVSLVQLRDGHFPDVAAAVLQASGLGANRLEIEVTESVLADNDRMVIADLDTLRAMGVSISLDDFGTGYSSLSYLRRFSFDKIKIDKSFVQGQANDHGVQVILEAILSLSRSLGLPVIAEGVETQQQLSLLRKNHSSELQGYLLGRPMPAAAVAAFLERHGSHAPAPALADPATQVLELAS